MGPINEKQGNGVSHIPSQARTTCSSKDLVRRRLQENAKALEFSLYHATRVLDCTDIAARLLQCCCIAHAGIGHTTRKQRHPQYTGSTELITAPLEKDRATATGNVHRKFGVKFGLVIREIDVPMHADSQP